jgi:hypothetical protein
MFSHVLLSFCQNNIALANYDFLSLQSILAIFHVVAVKDKVQLCSLDS